MKASRRQFLSSVVLAATRPRRPGLAPPNLAEDQIVRTVAGIRPYRRGGPRLEREELGGKTVVHKYGHGDAGYTLSWGSAEVVAEVRRLEARPGRATRARRRRPATRGCRRDEARQEPPARRAHFMRKRCVTAIEGRRSISPST